MENTYKELVTTASLFAVYVQEVRKTSSKKRLLKRILIQCLVNRQTS